MSTSPVPLELELQRMRVRRAVSLSSVAALGGFLFGYDTAVINGTVNALRASFHAGETALGFAVASALIGCAFGAGFAGRFATRFGQTRVMVAAALLLGVSATGSGLARSIAVLTLWRVVGGLGIGAASVIAPAYITEIAPAELRGRLGSLQQLAIVTGIFMALTLDTVLARLAGGAMGPLLGQEAWRWMFLSLLVPGVLYGWAAARAPESPRYLVAKGRIPEARKVLMQLLPVDAVEPKLAEISATLEGSPPSRLSDLRGTAFGLKPIVWIGVAVSVFQQLVGINVIFYYSSVLWQQVGFKESDAFVITVITSVINIATTLVAVATIDRVGRRALLLVGSAGMTVTLGALAVVFATAPLIGGAPVLSPAAGKVALVAANLFVVFFGMSWGPVVWVLLGEMFSNRIRAMALAVATAAQWIANFAITTTFPALAAKSLGLAYGIYAGCALLSLLLVARFVRETKGVEIEAVDDAHGVGA